MANPSITDSRDAVREALKQDLLTDGKGWMQVWALLEHSHGSRASPGIG